MLNAHAHFLMRSIWYTHKLWRWLARVSCTMNSTIWRLMNKDCISMTMQSKISRPLFEENSSLYRFTYQWNLNFQHIDLYETLNSYSRIYKDSPTNETVTPLNTNNLPISVSCLLDSPSITIPTILTISLMIRIVLLLLALAMECYVCTVILISLERFSSVSGTLLSGQYQINYRALSWCVSPVGIWLW